MAQFMVHLVLKDCLCPVAGLLASIFFAPLQGGFALLNLPMLWYEHVCRAHICYTHTDVYMYIFTHIYSSGYVITHIVYTQKSCWN